MLVSLIDSWLSLSADIVFIVSWFSDIDNTCQLINLLFTVVDYPMFNVWHHFFFYQFHYYQDNTYHNTNENPWLMKLTDQV